MHTFSSLYIYIMGQNNFCRLYSGGDTSACILPSGSILVLWLIGETQHMYSMSMDNKTTKSTYIQMHIVLQSSHLEKLNAYSRDIIGSKLF